MKKVYFACSIRGGRGDQAIYAELVAHLKNQCELLTEIFADSTLTSQGTNKPSADIWQQDLAWVREADAVIAEVTNPSLGVGYEIAKAEEWDKPVLCLYRPGKNRTLSAMIDGSPKTQVEHYQTIEEAQAIIENFLSKP